MDESVGNRFSKYASTHGPGLAKRIMILITVGIKNLFQVISEMIRQAFGKE